MRRTLIIFCAACSLLLAASPALSQDQDREIKGKGACRADILKFCNGIKPGDGRIWACLKGNEDRLSDTCKVQMARVREKAREFKEACQADAGKFCKGIPPGQGRIAACLKSHEAELSEACRAVFKK